MSKNDFKNRIKVDNNKVNKNQTRYFKNSVVKNNRDRKFWNV